MYKDKEKERNKAKERMRRYRQKGVTDIGEGVTIEGITYPDIIDKLTDPFWRTRLEKICNAFQSSHHSSFAEMCWLGDTNLSLACDWLECTS